MNIYRYMLVLSFVALLLGGCRRADVESFTIRVPEMTDGTHRTLIQRTLESMDGVQRKTIRIDANQRLVTLQYDSMKTAEKNMEIAISNLGFSANGIPANQKKAAQLKRLGDLQIIIPEMRGATSKVKSETIGRYIVAKVSGMKGILPRTIRIDPTKGILFAQFDTGITSQNGIEKGIASLGFSANTVAANQAVRSKLPPELR